MGLSLTGICNSTHFRIDLNLKTACKYTARFLVKPFELPTSNIEKLIQQLYWKDWEFLIFPIHYRSVQSSVWALKAFRVRQVMTTWKDGDGRIMHAPPKDRRSSFLAFLQDRYFSHFQVRKQNIYRHILPEWPLLKSLLRSLWSIIYKRSLEILTVQQWNSM